MSTKTHAMTSLTPMLRDLWTHVVRIARAQTAHVYSRDEHIRALMREHTAVLPDALDQLAKAGYLRRSSSTAWADVFWADGLCVVPEGCEAPSAALPSGAAGPRRHVNASMPVDTSVDTAPRPRAIEGGEQYPSRRGARLHWRDGRVTDLEGRPC